MKSLDGVLISFWSKTDTLYKIREEMSNTRLTGKDKEGDV